MNAYLHRKLDMNNLLADRSCFLLGPRQSGKSSYIRHQLIETPALTVDFLEQDTFYLYQREPSRLRHISEAKKLHDTLIIIDEVQRHPDILQDVHWLIENRQIRFLLTGSSARQLKRKGTNLLGGRARMRNLHPLSWSEITDFSLEKALYRGLLPPHWFSNLVDEDLAAYVGRYLSEEIASEGMARSLPEFSRFLEVAAAMNTQTINMNATASDTGVSRQTISSWFQILYDTHIAYRLEPWRQQVTRKLTTMSKFYMFDLGVSRFLKRLGTIEPGSKDFGDAFEHFIFLELQTWIDYCSPKSRLSYWRTQRGEYEVDFILELDKNKQIAIEVKAATHITGKHLSGLRAIQQEGIADRHILVSREPEPRKPGDDNILILPWENFLHRLWNTQLWTED
ncbi:ATP-binding protein [Spirochaeta dissipatitropha]